MPGRDDSMFAMQFEIESAAPEIATSSAPDRSSRHMGHEFQGNAVRGLG